MFQGKKYPSGEKKEWYLTKDDIIALSREYQDNENVLMLALGISVGGRWSSLVETVPEKMNFAEKRISMYETKRQHWVTRRLLKPLIPLLKDYIADYHIGATEPLFTQSYGWYAVKMSEAGRRAKLRLHVSTHILKHTFVSQALKHGVSAEIIVAQTGTDWETLKKHYTAEDEAKGDHELQGEKYDVQPFPEWYAELMPFFRAAYERIKSEGISNGFRARLIEPEQSI